MPDQHPIDELSLLLPFYVNGTLGASYRAKIDAALAVSPELRAELVEVRAVADQVKRGGAEFVGHENSAKPSPQHEPEVETLAALGKLRPHSPARTSRPRLAGLVRPARWHVVAAAGLAAVAVAQSLWIAGTPRDNTYQTASREPETALHGPPRLIVRFKPDARWMDIEALLAALSLSVVSGPAEGRFTVQLDGPAKGHNDAQKSLAESPLVEFAGRAE